MKYKPGLDFIRAFAVTFVIIHHWFPDFLPGMDWGTLGVDIFFFLSGFLITTGLIRDLKQPAGEILKNFYARRTLRIFPLYYAVILFLVIVGIIKSEWPWFVTYTSNHYFYNHGWQGTTSHFWSLAVEEQFYLVWPLLVIIFRKRLPLMMLATVVFSYMTREFMAGEDKGEILTVTNMYKFALGGLFAYYIKYIKPMSVMAGVAPVLLCVVVYLLFPEHRPWAVPVLSFGLFHIALKGWFDFGPMVYMGRISYGVYIFHNIVPYFVVKVMSKDNPWFFVICFVVLIGVSALSFELFERQVLKLKKRFVYKREKEFAHA